MFAVIGLTAACVIGAIIQRIREKRNVKKRRQFATRTFQTKLSPQAANALPKNRRGGLAGSCEG